MTDPSAMDQFVAWSATSREKMVELHDLVRDFLPPGTKFSIIVEGPDFGDDNMSLLGVHEPSVSAMLPRIYIYWRQMFNRKDVVLLDSKRGINGV